MSDRGHGKKKGKPWPLFASVSTVLVLCAAAVAAAQNVETDPLQCWWRTSSGAIRVGEPFMAVLTCGVIDTLDVKVVVDESRLEPSVAQFVPFEVLGGSHAADLREGDRRFFQYEYRLRLIAENMFGKDVALPETKLSYRIQSKVSQKAAVEGRDQTYLLPPLAMRVLSLVPGDATDIRDASSESFADVDRRAFRANLMTVVAGVLFALAALIAILAVVRIYLRTRKQVAAPDRLVGDAAILRTVGRELAAVQRQREDGGWTAELAGRALAAVRIVAAYAMGRRAARIVLNGKALGDRRVQTDTPDGGALIVKTGWPRSKTIAVSAADTAQTVGSAIARSTNGRPGELESLQEALKRFTAAQYGRGDNGSMDASSLDESLGATQQVLRTLKLEQNWIVKKVRPQRRATVLESRAWSH